MICNDQRFFHALMILLKFNQLMLGSIKLQLSNLMCNCCSSFDSSVHQRAAKSSCSTLIIKLEDIKARSLHINISIASTFPVRQSLSLIKKNKEIKLHQWNRAFLFVLVFNKFSKAIFSWKKVFSNVWNMIS